MKAARTSLRAWSKNKVAPAMKKAGATHATVGATPKRRVPTRHARLDWHAARSRAAEFATRLAFVWRDAAIGFVRASRGSASSSGRAAG